MEKLVPQVDAVIQVLQDMREDAEKVDKGQAGMPGTRLRKLALDVRNRMNTIRGDVLEARKADS